MNTTPEPPKNTTATPLPNLEQLILSLGHPNRWKILKELTCGETRTIAELAKVAGCGYDNAAKHLQQLFRAGMVVRARRPGVSTRPAPSARARPAGGGLWPLPPAPRRRQYREPGVNQF